MKPKILVEKHQIEVYWSSNKFHYYVLFWKDLKSKHIVFDHLVETKRK